MCRRTNVFVSKNCMFFLTVSKLLPFSLNCKEYSFHIIRVWNLNIENKKGLLCNHSPVKWALNFCYTEYHQTTSDRSQAEECGIDAPIITTNVPERGEIVPSHVVVVNMGEPAQFNKNKKILQKLRGEPAQLIKIKNITKIVRANTKDLISLCKVSAKPTRQEEPTGGASNASGG